MSDSTTDGKSSATVINIAPSTNWQAVAEKIHKTLGGHKTSNGFQVYCPCHEDSTASLDVSVGHDKLLWNCKAGCKQADVEKALIERGLYAKRKPKFECAYDYGAFQKLRFKDPKTFRIRHKGPGDEWIYKFPPGLTEPPLYSIDKLKADRSAVAVICEGEKDADAFNKLELPGYVATTNFEGSGKWRNCYTAALQGRHIIIVEDNDEPGRERTERLLKEFSDAKSVRVVRFQGFAEKYDLADWLNDHPKEMVVPELIDKAEVIDFTNKPKKHVPDATRADYFKLFEDVLGPLPRDIFTGNCLVLDTSSGLYEPAWNLLSLVKAQAQALQVDRIRRYRMSSVEDFFTEYERQKPLEFVIPIPAWDGRDRLKELAEACILDGSQDFPTGIIEKFFKGWMVGVIRKLRDPRHQNPCLILRSEKQGIGKDTLVNAMTDGFGQWSGNLNLTQNERDNYIELTYNAVLKIAEFDRTSRTDMATIKDMIFRDSTRLRKSHARDAATRMCRASFVATVNPEDFYRDSTGHRRYVVFNLSRIEFNYPRTIADSRQIIAQAYVLLEQNYQIPQMYLDAMSRFLESKTPDSPEQMITEHWAVLCNEMLMNNVTIWNRGWASNAELLNAGIYERFTKLVGMKLNSIRGMLKREGYEFYGRIEGIVTRGYWFIPREQRNMLLQRRDSVTDNPII